MSKCGFFGPGVVLSHPSIQLANKVFLGEDVVIYGRNQPGSVELGEKSCLHRGTIIETSEGGAVTIGTNSHIQPSCQLSAHKGSIRIGNNCQLAPKCGLYPYNHGTEAGTPMRVVAAGALVRQDVPPNAIVAGVPARVVGQR